MIDLQLERPREKERRKKERVIARGRKEGTGLLFLRRPNYLAVRPPSHSLAPMHRMDGRERDIKYSVLELEPTELLSSRPLD